MLLLCAAQPALAQAPYPVNPTRKRIGFTG